MKYCSLWGLGREPIIIPRRVQKIVETGNCVSTIFVTLQANEWSDVPSITENVLIVQGIGCKDKIKTFLSGKCVGVPYVLLHVLVDQNRNVFTLWIIT